jgi:type I restriction enzyme, S subunit
MKHRLRSVALDSLCDIEYGTRVTRKKDGGSEYPVYGGGGKTFYIDKFNRENVFIVSRFGMSENCTRFVPGKFFLNDSGLSLSSKKEYNILNDFLGYQLLHRAKDIYNLGRGTAQKNLDVKNFRKMEFKFIDSLDEQKRIVEKLDTCMEQIDKAIQNVEENIQNAEDLFQSQLNEIFSQKAGEWIEDKLGNCLKLKSGDGLTSKNMNQNGDYDVYGGNGVVGKHDMFNIQGSQVIIGRVGAQCGNVRNVNEKIWLTDNAFKVSEFFYDFDKLFLTYMLNFKNLRNYARQTAQPVISNSSTKDITLCFPKNIELQKSIASQLEELKSKMKVLEFRYQQELGALDDLKKSILEKAFNGEL